MSAEEVIATIRPKNGAPIATHDAAEGVNGFASVADATERDAVPARISVGCWRKTRDDGKVWECTSLSPLTWVEVTFGSGTATSLYGIPLDGATNADGQVYIREGGSLIHRSLTLDDLGPAAAINSFARSLGSLIEVGSQLATTDNLTGTYSVAPTALVLTDDQGNPPVNVLSTPALFHAGVAITKNVYGNTAVLTLTATINGRTVTRNLTITWARYMYYGIYDSAAVGTMASKIQAMTHELTLTGRKDSFSATADTSTKYLAFALRDSYSDPGFIIGAGTTPGVLPGGMTKLASGIVIPSTSGGVNDTYALWTSDNPNLGLSNVQVIS